MPLDQTPVNDRRYVRYLETFQTPTHVAFAHRAKGSRSDYSVHQPGLNRNRRRRSQRRGTPASRPPNHANSSSSTSTSIARVLDLLEGRADPRGLRCRGRDARSITEGGLDLDEQIVGPCELGLEEHVRRVTCREPLRDDEARLNLDECIARSLRCEQVLGSISVDGQGAISRRAG